MDTRAPDPLLTTAEARAKLKVGRHKLSELIRSGDLEAARLGHSTFRIRESAVLRLLDARRVVRR
jgi:excisionase family DNA binding protein